MFFEVFMMLVIYLGNTFMQKFSVICYTLRILTLIIWGGYIMNESDYKIGE